MSHKAKKNVTLLVHTASDWTRLLLKGVASYVSEASDPWDVFLEPRGFHEQLSLPANRQHDGAILRLTHPELHDAIVQQNIPAVNVSWLGEHSLAIPKVISDERACAALSVDHLIEKGFVGFGFFGPNPNMGYSDAISSECNTLATGECSTFPQTAGKVATNESVARWIQGIPKPAGIVTWNAIASKRVMDACTQLGLHIPHDVGIVCIEHDHLMASMSAIPLTSIDQDPANVGYEAARLLDSLLNGGKPPEVPVRIRPQGIICRQSTETATNEDELVRQALQFINDNFSRPIRVADISTKLDLSRRQLEHRFRHAINSTPANEIRRIRLANVKRLLVETSLGLDKIAVMSGYDYTEVMTRAFKQAFSQTPGEYRKTH